MLSAPGGIEPLLGQVEKPGRYLGNERGVIRKDVRTVALRFALAFPEVYEIAQSHLGLQILYDLLNRRKDVYAERVYAPWLDLEKLLREHGQPLVSLETSTPLADFDILGFSLQYELTYTNLLTMLDLGGITLLAAERRPEEPLIIAGGPSAFNAEPLASFLDAILLGDGEEAIHDICDAYLAWDHKERRILLEALAQIEGLYIPAFYTPEYAANGRLVSIQPNNPDHPPAVRKRILPDLDTVPTQDTYLVPTLKVVHARPSLEVMRGCVKGCRFCQAGFIYRPLRERDPRLVLRQAERALAATGADELSLLSLSSSDYSCINPLLTELMNRFASDCVALSLPSTRVDALGTPILEQIRRVRKTGFTLAPEAGTQRMRDFLHKEYREEELLEAARQIFALGWRSLKLYFMIGLPGEEEEDLRAIADLSARVAAMGPRRVEVTASVSTFVPRPHTPFQWEAQIDRDEIERRQAFLRQELHRRKIRFKWHDANESYLEGIFARGDRRLSDLLLTAYHLGCRFDGWTEAYRPDLWERALRETGIDPREYLRRRGLDETLPWDHLDSGVTKEFLQQELTRAAEGLSTPDCSVERCTYCGACDFHRVRNVDYHLEGARGSDHRGKDVDQWACAVTGGKEENPGHWEPRGWHKIRQRLNDLDRQQGENASSQGSPIKQGDPPQLVRAMQSAAHDQPKGKDTRVPGAERAANPSSSSRLGTAEEWLSARPARVAPPVNRSNAPPVVRSRVTYHKLGRARFISHLEMIAVFASAFRRSRLPVAFSQGHRPLPLFRFSPGLPVGCESDCEVLDVDFTRPVGPEALTAALRDQLPEGLTVADVQVVSRKEPALETTIRAMRYRVGVHGLVNGNGGSWVDERIARFLNSPSFVVHKRTGKSERELDARPLVTRIERVDASHMEIDLIFDPKGSVRPIDFLAALFDLDVTAARALPMRKIRCFYRSDDSQPPSAPPNQSPNDQEQP